MSRDFYHLNEYLHDARLQIELIHRSTMVIFAVSMEIDRLQIADSCITERNLECSENWEHT
jgi:hypothetical protein